MEIAANPVITKIAKAGLIAKGIVYVMMGIIGFMAAFEIGKQSDDKANSNGIFTSIQDLPAGAILLIILASGLVCYTIWRFIEAIHLAKENKKAGWLKSARYFISGVAYGSLAYSAIRMILHEKSDNRDQKQQMAEQLLNQSYGQALAIAVALILAGIGIYQLYYGFTEKFKKHLSGLQSENSDLLYKAAKIGYIARGLVWIIIGYLFLQAGLHSNSAEAGDTDKAFQFIETSEFGSFLLGLLSVGVILYGVYNFIRARYEQINS